MSHLFGVTTHGYDRPLAAASCPRILSEYHRRSEHPGRYYACDVGRTAAVFPDRDLRQADVLYGSNDGYSYGSGIRARLLRRRYFPPAETPRDTFRLPPLTSIEYHWFLDDPALAPGYDAGATRNPFGQCEVAARRYPPPRVAGLTNRELERTIRLQERGLLTRSTGAEPTGEQAQAPSPPEALKQRAAEEAAEDARTGRKPGEVDPLAALERAEASHVKVDPPALETCQRRPAGHLWYKNRRRYPQFYSAMTRFVETVRINDKMFELF